jgi:hypothetical protein
VKVEPTSQACKVLVRTHGVRQSEAQHKPERDDQDARSQDPSAQIADAHEWGLFVHPFTFWSGKRHLKPTRHTSQARVWKVAGKERRPYCWSGVVHPAAGRAVARLPVAPPTVNNSAQKNICPVNILVLSAMLPTDSTRRPGNESPPLTHDVSRRRSRQAASPGRSNEYSEDEPLQLFDKNFAVAPRSAWQRITQTLRSTHP